MWLGHALRYELYGGSVDVNDAVSHPFSMIVTLAGLPLSEDGHERGELQAPQGLARFIGFFPRNTVVL